MDGYHRYDDIRFITLTMMMVVVVVVVMMMMMMMSSSAEQEYSFKFSVSLRPHQKFIRAIRDAGSRGLYVHRNRKDCKLGTGSPGRPPRLSHSSVLQYLSLIHI